MFAKEPKADWFELKKAQREVKEMLRKTRPKKKKKQPNERTRSKVKYKKYVRKE